MHRQTNFTWHPSSEKRAPIFVFVASFMAASLMAVAVLAFGTTG